MTKTFKSVNADAKKDLLVVLGVDEGVNIHTESPTGRRGVSVAPSDAPALALAILEAAGGRNSLGIDVGNAIIDLREYVTEQERITAKVKDKAELEAEALELFNTQVRALGDGLEVDSLDDMHHIAKESWLAVARKARELGGSAEK